MGKHEKEKPEGKKSKGNKPAKAHLFLGHGKTKTPKGQRTRRSWLRPEIAAEKPIPPMSDFELIPNGFDGKGRQKYIYVFLPTGESFSQKEYNDLRSDRTLSLRLAATSTRPANASA